MRYRQPGRRLPQRRPEKIAVPSTVGVTQQRVGARAADVDPTSAEARLAAGRALAALGRSDEAAVAFRGALELAPTDPTPHLALAESASLAPRERAEHLLRAGELETVRFETDDARARFEEAGASTARCSRPRTGTSPR